MLQHRWRRRLRRGRSGVGVVSIGRSGRAPKRAAKVALMDRPRTKQVCTIGPASADKIPDLIAAGMDVARVNFSHGTADDHKAFVHAVRAAAHSARRSVAVMVDLPGPKLRLGDLDGGEALLLTGGTFTLRSQIQAAPSPDLSAEPIAEPATEPPLAVDVPTEPVAARATDAEPDATAEPEAVAS